jgi:hypothetical protein
MRHPALVALAALAAVLSAPALAQEGGPQPVSTGLTATASIGGGAEMGLEEGKDGVLEAEVAVGWELESIGVRPELAIALGLEPDNHVAFRPGVRVSLPGLPIQLRAALDASNARDTDLRWRWLLVGAAAEVRFTNLLGLYGEIDTGAPLGSEAGLPLLVRAGASFRF